MIDPEEDAAQAALDKEILEFGAEMEELGPEGEGEPF